MKNTEGELTDVCVNNVYHVKELKETLLSLTTATKKHGYTFVQSPTATYLETPSGDKLPLVDDGRELEEMVVYLKPPEKTETAFAVRKRMPDPNWGKPEKDKVDINDLHERTGHCAIEDLKGLAEDFEIELEGELTHCEACAVTKSKRVKFRREAKVPALKELERVHDDTSGPFARAMLSGAKYMFLFVDAKKQECGKHI